MSQIRTRLAGWIASATLALGLVAGCLQRPIAEPSPRTSATFVDQLAQTSVDKIDLLFVIDNSSSMADKQKFLSLAVPRFLGRLVNPDCIETATGVRHTGPGADVACPAGSVKAFRAIDDIHVGVVTSSLGGHGGVACSEAWGTSFDPQQDDHAHLVPSVRSGLPDNHGLDFLAWDPRQKANPPGTADLDTLIRDFETVIGGVGEIGCGYEATLESWYRFLVDPEPPARVVVESKLAHPDGVDQTVLAQRAAFLRPDSLLAIVMLSDENDCSIVDGGSGWVVTTASLKMPRATSACAVDANSVCCRPCLKESSPPSGCTPIADDAECKKGALTGPEDQANLRCFEQKRRFGIDLLYPTSRYVDALKSHTVTNRAGAKVANPIFSAPAGSGVLPRGDDLVFLAGIVGVPWQDIATDASLTSATELTYLTADELGAGNRWDTILGDPAHGIAPGDPLMRESVAPRRGNNPIIGAPLVDPSSLDPRANPINGHEYRPKSDADLQYACTFELPNDPPIDCSGLPDGTCDCTGTPDVLAAVNSPLCNPPGGGTATSIQHYAKGYPGLRHLEVLRGIGDNAIVASICPKVTSAANPDDPSFGYNPAVQAILQRIEVALTRCLPRKLNPDPVTRRLPCAVIQATLDPVCDCSGAGYTGERLSDSTRTAVLSQLESTGVCTSNPRTPTDLACSGFCLCEIQQTLDPSARNACENVPDETIDPEISGYCYVDPQNHVGNPALVGVCPVGRQRLLRFVGKVPAPRSVVFMACAESTSTDPVPVVVDAGAGG